MTLSFVMLPLLIYLQSLFIFTASWFPCIKHYNRISLRSWLVIYRGLKAFCGSRTIVVLEDICLMNEHLWWRFLYCIFILKICWYRWSIYVSLVKLSIKFRLTFRVTWNWKLTLMLECWYYLLGKFRLINWCLEISIHNVSCSTLIFLIPICF